MPMVDYKNTSPIPPSPPTVSSPSLFSSRESRRQPSQEGKSSDRKLIVPYFTNALQNSQARLEPEKGTCLHWIIGHNIDTNLS